MRNEELSSFTILTAFLEYYPLLKSGCIRGRVTRTHLVLVLVALVALVALVVLF